MKKLVLLSLVSLMTMFVWATEPTRTLYKPIAGPKPGASSYTRNNKPKSQRSGALQKVLIGKAGNVLSILNANCHQLDLDSAMNTVLFIHRSDTVTGYAAANVAQYRFDLSKDGGATWNVNIGPLNPLADNITINGRYPQAVLTPDSANPTIADSARIVYNGSWHNGGTSNVWQGQYYGVGQLTGNPSTFTEHHEIVNNANVEIATSMIQTSPGHYWNVNMNYTLLSSTMDTVRGIILERGLWNDSAHEVLWTYQNIDIGSALVYDASGAVTGNNLGNPTIAFDPTGKYGWILLNGDITNDANFTSRPILMQSTDYGATWSAPQSLTLDNLPGMFPTSSSATNGGKTVVGGMQIAVDSAGNPHIAAVVGQADTTSNQYSFYIFQEMVLYDLYYNPSVSGCSWQANYLSRIHGYSAYYTSDNTGDGNRVQISRSKDGKKIFIFWADTDSSVVAGITDVNNTNPNPNLFGIGIDMGIRKTTNVVNFTAGDPLFGGQVPSQSLTNGTYGGALFPVVSPNVFNQGGGNFNIPVVLTDPDYHQAVITSKVSTNPASFYYCQNINFTQAQFVNRFDNAPPSLTLNGPDTVFVLLGQPYTPPTATAYDCVYGNITPTYSSTVPTNGSGNTDSAGVFLSTWTATNPSGNSATHTQVVIVSGPPIARIYYVQLTGTRFAFTDTSLNFPTNRIWYWGDGTTNNLNQVHATKVYTTGGTKCVILKVSNQYGTSSDTVCVQVHLAGINDVELSNKISVYPNPSSGIMTLELADDIANGANVSVFNILGEQVSETITVKPSVTKSVLNLSNLESGVYLLKVETPTGTAVKQIAINK